MTTKGQQALFHNKGAKQVMKQLAKVDDNQDTLFKGKLDLTVRERLVLEAMMLTPVIVVLAILYITHNFVLTLLGFHVALIAFPIIFAKKKNVNIDWIALFKQDLIKYTRKLKQDIYLIAVPCAMIVSAYILYRMVFPDYAYNHLRLPSIHDTVTAILLVIEFIFINPVVEEVFWRFFCDLFIGRGQTVLQKMNVAFHFALYHWFVAYYITSDVYLTTAGALVLFGLGYILTLIKQRFGLITTMVIHLGVDLAAGFVVWDMQSRIFPFY